MSSILMAAMEPARAALEAMCLKQLKFQSDKIEARLNECGGDFKAAYPYNSGREMYARREVARSLTVMAPNAPCVSRPSWPEPRVMRPDLAEWQAAQSRAFAASFIDAFVAKMLTKVGTVESASYSGSADPFSNSRLVVNGVVWNTKCIINVSKYGKLFNQWPTRMAS
jgi:hypothetical protein